MRLFASLACILIQLSFLEAQTRATPEAPTFTAGSIPIFMDSLENEKLGEFPSRWNLLLNKGLVEVMEMEGTNAIGFVSASRIEPLMKSVRYLPTNFTLEFEAYFHNIGNEAYSVGYDQREMLTRISLAGIKYGGTLTRTVKKREPGWKKVRISSHERAYKAFLDDEMLINQPNVDQPPSNFFLDVLSGNSRKNKYALIRNVRLMEGGMPLYDRLFTEAGFSTNNLQFSVGNADISEASNQLLAKLTQVLKAHPEIQVIIEGHTDGSGTVANNQALGQARAEAVKSALISRGIAANRLATISFGEEQPLGDNDTEEGRYLNRRVVFRVVD